MNRRNALAALAAGLGLGGCVTPYGPAGLTGGYSEVRIDDQTWTVSFNGNGYTPEEKVFNYWVYRCAELTVKNGFEFFAPLVPEQKPARADADDGWSMHPAKGSAPTYIYVPGAASRSWRGRATIRMFKAPLPIEVPFALSAPRVMDLLKDYVVSEGAKPAPSKEELFRRAAVVNGRAS